MKRRILPIAVALIPLVLSGCASTGAIDDSKLGKLASNLGLSSAFGKLGISPEQAAKFIPEVTGYVSSAASPDVGMSFANALK